MGDAGTGRWTPHVQILGEELPNKPLCAAALLKLKQPVPIDDPSLKILKWTFAEHMPTAWVSMAG